MLSHTNYLSAEKIAMLMSPDVRRTAILLSTLKKDAKIRVHPKMLLPADQFTSAFNVTFVSLDEMKNCLLVKVDGHEVGVPLDQVSAWYEGNECHISCDRRLIADRR